VSVPQNLSAFAGNVEDFEWTPLEPLPVKPDLPTVQPKPVWKVGQPFEPEKFNEDPLAWSARYVDALTSRPNWCEELAAHNQAVKLAKREERRQRRKIGQTQ
jgi:hypothetical protein